MTTEIKLIIMIVAAVIIFASGWKVGSAGRKRKDIKDIRDKGMM